jgi:hypothetical protein
LATSRSLDRGGNGRKASVTPAVLLSEFLNQAAGTIAFVPHINGYEASIFDIAINTAMPAPDGTA